MATKTYIPQMQAYLDREITALKREMDVIRGDNIPLDLPASEAISRSTDNVSSQSAEKSAVEKLDQQFARLEQIRQWLAQDHNLKNLVDAAIAMQVRASERRQSKLSIVLTIASVLVGWLLSFLASPATLMDVLQHVIH